ncbi:hypothetical protein [Mucilaginibacter psychrotolerans]|uniref:DUF3575 domain-containing protein n=1 Tax=Mucilaginibacter psychrotolerans TaxID=1524096 RepID=A0A4Y8SAW5_9SPHI|nr:hypothetical protein [Mucilaginibacter psychrotolerans]TFF35775.1 hypothetical protein E2R66_17815 [Mucilaginibacter psychrotolerans]
MKHLISAFLLLASGTAFAQSDLKQNELSINGFRNPSIGFEYRHNQYSANVGYYTTAFKRGEFSNFVKVGYTFWFFPSGNGPIPSSFYAGSSYMRGLNRNYEGKNALGTEVGYRWVVWKGLNLRIGAIGVSAKGQSFKVNPTPGISYSITL